MFAIRSFFILAALAVFSLFLVACGGDKAEYGDTLHDKAAMGKFADAVRAFGKDKEVMIFQGFSMTTGSAHINMQSPDDSTKVVQQVWNVDKGWKTVPVTLTGDGDLESNLTPLSAVNFAAIVDFIQAAEKLVHDKGHKDYRLESVTVNWSWNDGSLSLVAGYPLDATDSESKAVDFEGTLDGKVTKAWFSWFNKEASRQERESLL